jgi:hypothetical protein
MGAHLISRGNHALGDSVINGLRGAEKAAEVIIEPVIKSSTGDIRNRVTVGAGT